MTKQDTELASKFSVSDYEKARDAQDRATIAETVRRRFTERYIEPVSGGNGTKHGFTMMAVSCLMIEALESFRQGWETSDGQSKAAFRFFFDTAHPFKEFRGHASSFYTHVRCGDPVPSRDDRRLADPQVRCAVRPRGAYD